MPPDTGDPQLPPPPPPPPPARPPGPAAPLVALTFAIVVFGVAWGVLGMAGLFRDDFPPPSDVVMALVLGAATVASMRFGHWATSGSWGIALVSVPVGFVLGFPLALILTGISEG